MYFSYLFYKKFHFIDFKFMILEFNIELIKNFITYFMMFNF